jgi:hypothetical protein
MKEDLIDTKLSLDLAYANAKTQINNSIIKKSKENAQLAQDVLKTLK